jgi:hypothetical protein
MSARQLPAYVDVVTLRGTNGEIDFFARNNHGVYVHVAVLDPRTVRVTLPLRTPDGER